MESKLVLHGNLTKDTPVRNEQGLLASARNDQLQVTLIVSFGGMISKFGGLAPFEFLNFLTKNYPQVDKHFYIDLAQARYHKGIEGMTTNIDETVSYLQKEIQGYKKVVFLGVSAGGYAAILFGSLLHINTVIAFIPQTKLDSQNPLYNPKYIDLKNIINNVTSYHLYGDLDVTDINDAHHISHCENIEQFPNVHIVRKHGIDLVRMRNSGELLEIISNII
jgi:hypothetical protein